MSVTKQNAKRRVSIKNIVLLQLVVVVYTLASVAAKAASGEEFFSVSFLGFYGLEMVILGVYAILWQQIIKRFQLSVAYANRAMALLWSLIWAVLFFGETITVKNVIGVVIVMIGTMVVNSDE